jgi:hypothetical protein
MNNIKINLIIVVQGASMMSEQECSKQLRKPIINKRGKYAGKQARDKRGNLLWHYETVPDLTKYNRHDVGVNSLTEKRKTEILTYYTRKSREVKQSINMCQEVYDYMISSEMPRGYRAPKNFKPYMPIRSRLDRKTKKWVDGVPFEVQAWRAASIQQRLEWHLNAIAASLGGRVDSYTVFDD